MSNIEHKKIGWKQRIMGVGFSIIYTAGVGLGSVGAYETFIREDRPVLTQLELKSPENSKEFNANFDKIWEELKKSNPLRDLYSNTPQISNGYEMDFIISDGVDYDYKYLLAKTTYMPNQSTKIPIRELKIFSKPIGTESSFEEIGGLVMEGENPDLISGHDGMIQKGQWLKEDFPKYVLNFNKSKS